MKLTKISFELIGKKLRQAMLRFPLTIVCILTLAVLMIVNIHNHFSHLIDERLWWFLGLSIPLSLAFYLFAENRINCLLKNGLNILLVGLIAWFTLTLTRPIIDAESIRMIAIGVSFGLAVFFAPYITGKRPLSFWEYVQELVIQLITSYVFAGILMGGLSLALVSLDKLFGVDIHTNTYSYLSVICVIVFAPLYFLSTLPKGIDEEQIEDFEFPKIYKILGLYILLPIIAIYIVILYGYLGKIIFTWQLPNGWVSWLVSILGITGYLTISLLHPLYLKGENKVTKLFTRFFPVILIPLLTLMLVGIIRRFSDYGITINRSYVLLLNLWLFGISIFLFITQTKQIKGIFISFALVAFLFSIGPWSVFSITEHSLKSELKQLLTGVKPTDKSGTNSTISNMNINQKKRIFDVIKYMEHTYSKKSVNSILSTSLGKDANSDDLIKLLHLSSDTMSDKYISVTSVDESTMFNISEYQTCIKLVQRYDNSDLFKNDSLSVKVKGKTIEILRTGKSPILIPLDNILAKDTDHKANFKTEELTLIGNDYKLVIFVINGNRKAETNEVKINYINAILFLK